MSETTEVHAITTLPKKSLLSITARKAAIAAVAVGVGIIVIAKIATRNVSADDVTAVVEA